MIDKIAFQYRKPIFVSSIKGEHIRLRNSNLIVEDKKGKIICQESCYNIMMLYVVGDISITTAMIRNAKKYGFTIVFMNSMCRCETMIGNYREGQMALRKRQYEYRGDELANWIIQNKVANQIKVAERIHKDTYLIEDLQERAAELRKACLETDSLRGVEGTIAGIYFRLLFSGEDWKGRKPRQRKDFINASMDIGYTILFNFLETIVRYYGFDVYKGFYHTEFWTRKSLICDLIEPMRPIIDEKICICIRQRRMVPDDFYKKKGSLELKQKKWPEYQIYFMEAIMQYKEDMFLFIRNFYRKFASGADFSAYVNFKMR